MASSYPTEGPTHYYGSNPQDEAYHDPPQFYNPHAPHETYDQSGYREPEVYVDEPSYTLPQGQSAEPLELNTKEEPDYAAEEFTPTPRKPRCVHRLTAPSNYLGLPYWSVLKIGVLGVCGHGDTNKVAAFGHRCTHVSNRVGGNVVYADNPWLQISGKQAAMSLSLRLLHHLHHVIPSRIHFSYTRLGAYVCRAS
jgi:hypothetical protein